MTFLNDEDQIEKFFNFVQIDDEAFVTQTFKGTIVSEKLLVDNADDLIEEANKHTEEGLICLSANPRDSTEGGIDSVSNLNNIVIDIDVRDDYKEDGVSPEDAKEKAKHVVREVTKDLEELGLSRDLLVDSGNGYHIYVGIDLEKPEDWKNSDIHNKLKELQDRLKDNDTEVVEVDTLTKDIARRMKIAGTHNVKPEISEENYRMAEILEIEEPDREENSQALMDIEVQEEEEQYDFTDDYDNGSRFSDREKIEMAREDDDTLDRAMTAGGDRSDKDTTVAEKAGYYGFDVEIALQMSGTDKYEEKKKSGHLDSYLQDKREVARRTTDSYDWSGKEKIEGSLDHEEETSEIDYSEVKLEDDVETLQFRNLFNEGHMFNEFLKRTEKTYPKQEFNFGSMLGVSAIVADGFYGMRKREGQKLVDPNILLILSGRSSSGKSISMSLGENLLKDVDIYDRGFKKFIPNEEEKEEEWSREFIVSGSLVGMIRNPLSPKVQIEYEEVDGNTIDYVYGINDPDEDEDYITEYRPSRKRRFWWTDEAGELFGSLDGEKSWTSVLTNLYEGSYQSHTVSQGRYSIGGLYINLVGALQPTNISEYFNRENVKQGTVYRFSVIQSDIPTDVDTEIDTPDADNIKLDDLSDRLSAVWQLGKMHYRTRGRKIEFILSEDARDVVREYQKLNQGRDVSSQVKSIVSKSYRKIYTYSLLFEMMSDSFISEAEDIVDDIYTRTTSNNNLDENSFSDWPENKISGQGQFFDYMCDEFQQNCGFLTAEISEASVKKAIWYIDNVIHPSLNRFTEGVEDTIIVKFLNRINSLAEEKKTRILSKREIARKCRSIEGVHYNSNQIFEYVSQMGSIKLVVPPPEIYQEMKENGNIPKRLLEADRNYDIDKVAVSEEKWNQLQGKQTVYFKVVNESVDLTSNNLEDPTDRIIFSGF